MACVSFAASITCCHRLRPADRRLHRVLILSALVFTPVSYVAPAREVSVLIGTFMGSRFLAEGNARQRLLAAAVILLGIIALAV